MEIRKLKADDYDELLSLLNTAFQRNDFDRLLPKMWQRDDEYMGKHFGLFEDSKLLATVGIYPFKVHIGDKVLNFAIKHLPKKQDEDLPWQIATIIENS